MRLEKNIVGSWGSNLSADDYACALAALGALEFRGTEQHPATANPNTLADALRKEFVSGERTVVWRAAQNVNRATTLSSWSDTIYTNPAALAAGWQRYRGGITHARSYPRLSVRLEWCNRPDLFNFQALCEWLIRPAVRLGALMFEPMPSEVRHRVGWHWPLRVGILAGPDQSKLVSAVDLARGQHPWIGDLSVLFTVGGARDNCDLLLLSSLDQPALRSEKRVHIRTSFVACLEDPPANLSAAIEQYDSVTPKSKAGGVAWVGKFDLTQHIANWFEAVIREVSHDVPIATTLSLASKRHGKRPLLRHRTRART